MFAMDDPKVAWRTISTAARLLALEELFFPLLATQGVKKRQEKYSFRAVPSGGARPSQGLLGVEEFTVYKASISKLR